MQDDLLLCGNGEQITISQCKQEYLVIDGHNFCEFCDNSIVKTIYERRIKPRFKTNMITYIEKYSFNDDIGAGQYLGTVVDVSVSGARVEVLEGYAGFNKGNMIYIDIFPIGFNKILFAGEIVYKVSYKKNKDSGILGIRFAHAYNDGEIESLISRLT